MKIENFLFLALIVFVLTLLATGLAKAETSNHSQSVTVNQPTVVKSTRTVIKHRTNIVQKRVLVYKPNQLLILGGATMTRLKIEVDCCNVYIKRAYEPDFGLQYIRDFGTVSASVIATSNGSMYLGLGVNW